MGKPRNELELRCEVLKAVMKYRLAAYEFQKKIEETRALLRHKKVW